MPKEMFYHIPLVKQEKFLDVAIQEFTSKPYELTSIKSIAKKAGISRGSFYTYFENKDCLFKYIFVNAQTQRLEYEKEVIKESQGDIFLFVTKMFEYDYKISFSNNEYTLLKNYMRYLRFQTGGPVLRSIFITLNGIDNNTKINYLKIFNADLDNVDQNVFLDLIDMILLIYVNVLLISESNKMSLYQSTELLKRRIEILKNGSKNTYRSIQ